MTDYTIDAEMLAKAFDALSELTGLSFSLYDDRQNILVPPSREDVIIAAVRAQAKGSQLMSSFMTRTITKALTTHDTVIEQGPTDQYHVFIPISCQGINVVVVADAFYIDNKDYIEFFVNKRTHFGISYESLSEHLVHVRAIPLERAEEIIKIIRPLLDSMLVSGYEKKELKRQSHWMKVVSGLIAGVRPDVHLRDLYKKVIEAATFVFAIESAVVFVMKGDSFSVECMSGRKHAFAGGGQLSAENQLVAKILREKTPLSVMDAHDALHAGFDDDIRSMYLFPVCTEKSFFGVIGIFNTVLEKYAFDSIADLCRMLANVFEGRSLAYGYYTRYEQVRSIFKKSSLMAQRCLSPADLHEQIVDEAARLMKVEKCSLMLPSEDGGMLSVAAVRGTMKELMSDVFVRCGEGIAGKTFKTRKHIMINTDDEMTKFVGGTKPSFKTSSCLSVPIANGDDIIGVLNLSDKIDGKLFTDDDVSLLDYFISQIYILLKLAAQHEEVRKMKDASFVDADTALFNRRYFDGRLEEEFKRSERHSLSFALALMRINGIRQQSLQGALDRASGLLRQGAESIKDAIRMNDVLMRFSDDDLALLMPQAGTDQALAVMERIRASFLQLSLPAPKYDGDHVTVSIGVATYPECKESPAALVHAADKAMYRAMKTGSDKVVLWQSIPEGAFEDVRRQRPPSGNRGGFVIPAD